MFSSLKVYRWSSPACSAFPCQGKVRALEPLVLCTEHSTLQMDLLQQRPAVLHASRSLLLAFWPKNPVPVDTSHSPWSSSCSHRDDATTGCLHHPFSSPPKWVQSRQESGGQAPGEGRGAVQDLCFPRMLYENHPQCWERSGASRACPLGHIQESGSCLVYGNSHINKWS